MQQIFIASWHFDDVVLEVFVVLFQWPVNHLGRIPSLLAFAVKAIDILVQNACHGSLQQCGLFGARGTQKPLVANQAVKFWVVRLQNLPWVFWSDEQIESRDPLCARASQD